MEQSKARVISGSSSIFLDVLRICAALTVLYIHAFDRWFPTQAHDQSKPGEPSHAAVIVFFVLSGYVIAHTTISNNRGKLQYARARLSRLCAMVIPALVITGAIQFFISHRDPTMMNLYSRGFTGLRYALSAFFCNEVWFFSAAPPLNGSLWSLSFEFWYYAIFGLWFFRSKSWVSLILVLLACVIAGPKILIMMPIWLSGYWAYSLPRPRLTDEFSWILVILSLILGWFALEFVPSIPFKTGYKPLYYANEFFTDWIIGLFVAAALWILPTGVVKQGNSAVTSGIRYVADLTFPLYVLHFPLLVLWRSIFGYRLNDMAQLWEAILSVLVVSGILGIVLEKQRPIWSKFFGWLLQSLKTLLSGKHKSAGALPNTL